MSAAPIILALPYPPSVNRIWRSVAGRNIKSKAYRLWLDAAAYEVRCQRPRGIVGHYTMRLDASAPDRRRRDLSNTLKAIEDALVQAGVIRDDSDAQSITLAWTGAIVKGGAITVHLCEAA